MAAIVQRKRRVTVQPHSEREPAARNDPALVRRLLVQIVVPCVIGVATGACVAGASHLVEDRALVLLASVPGDLPALPSLIALIVTLGVVRYVTRASRPSTAEVYIHAFHERDGRIRLRELPGRVLAAATTVAGGGSQGLESPSALIGASLGQIAGQRFRVAPSELRSWLISGASAGIAAVFSSPGVGTMYGMEVPFRRDVDATRLVPCAVAAGAAYATRSALIGPSLLVHVAGTPLVDATFALACLLVALGCGVGARLFALATEGLRTLGARTTPAARAVIGGVVLASLAWAGHHLTGAWITFGPGYFAADWIASLPRDAGLDAGTPPLIVVLAIAMLVRTAGTLTCVYGGGGGGVFTSLAVSGVFVGEIVARAFGRTESNFLPLLGAACFLGNGYRIPLAGMLLVAEATGDLLMTVVGLAAVGLGQVLMADDSVSDAKREARVDAGAPRGVLDLAPAAAVDTMDGDGAPRDAVREG